MKYEINKPLFIVFLVIFLIGLGMGVSIQANKSKRLESRNKELQATLAEGITTIEQLEEELQGVNRAMEEFIKEDERAKPENQEDYQEVGRQ